MQPRPGAAAGRPRARDAPQGKGDSEGADADIVVLDPAAVTDQATYSASTRPTTGIRHVLVNGAFVVRDEQARRGRPPGPPGARRPVTADPRRPRRAGPVRS